MMGQLMGALNSGGTPNPNPVSVPNGPLSMNQQGPMPPFLKQTPSAQDGGSTQPQQPAGMTKGAKLATILRSGLQGALAGRAASEKTIAETGGRRAGGFGTGFEAAMMQPYQIAGAQQELAQKKAQTELTKSQSQMVQTPYGMMPPALAKVIFPAQIRAAGAESVAQTNVTGKENVAQTQATSRENVAGINKRYVPVNGVGLFDTQTRQVMPGSEQGIVVTPEIAKDQDLPQEFIGKPMKLSDFSSVRRSDVFQNTPEMTAEGPIMVNRKTAQALPITGPGGQRYGPTMLARPTQVADENNPGQTVMVPAGQSFGKAGPQSASVQVPKKAAAAEVPSKIGDQKVAFNTAIQHADLLRQAAKALNNGDVRALASISNAAKTQFGDPDLTNFEAIANAYNHEVTQVISKGHITDSEVGKGNRTLPSSANYQTIDKVLNSYQSLMRSKMNMLNQQKNAAVSGSQKPNAKQNDPLGIR